ncbi:hypothetical protein BVRB_3g067910 [Beta vulgaris subsp. vulgaris]|uniref:BED-type domain-containing protein n=1 Tax=Beta vulgaris subsp. vulgaris TaxID=3555 RepID=A0A0J8E6R9_BETVV|nr:hypothetical protein BVRB_3g067910 [Beta vulgaris subsp. vulgaris]
METTSEDTPKTVGTSLDGDENEEIEGFIDKVERQTTKTAQKRKSTKERSDIWDHFTKFIAKGQGKCKCNYCGMSYKCAPRVNGTSTYRKHLYKCSKFPLNKCKQPEPNQTQLTFQSFVNEDGEQEGSVKNFIFNYDKCRKGLAYMVIVDELPFRFVEGQGFRHFCSLMTNKFHVPSRITVARDCYEIFMEERVKLKTFLKTNCRKVCLTTDTWTSIQKINYMCLTAHFIDNDWKLNKRILNFCPISSHKGEAIGKAIEKCLLAWGIENVMTVTVDNASSNDTAIVYLKKRLNNWGTSVVKGEFLHVRCIAHIMNLVVTDGLKLVSDSVHRVRNAVRFVRSSSNRVEKFKRCAVAEKISTQSMLCLDVPTRWNSTYLMLNTAVKFINAFERFDGEDNHYHDDLWDVNGYGNGLGKPVFEDWDHVKNLIILLEAFYSLTLRVSGSSYVTSDTYFHEVTDVDCLLKQWCDSSNEDFKSMALKMKEKCDKYWGDPTKFNVMLFLSAVLDPRYKWECVEYGICQMYESDVALAVCTRVKKAFRDIFDEYSHKGSLGANRPACTQSGVPYSTGVDIETSKENKGIIRARYKKLKATKEDGDSKSEIEKYLDEETVEDVDDFDILKWWKTNTSRFPTLSLIARDVLAIPVSTVASESAFSTGGRVLDPFRSSLTPKIVEALVCGQDWLRASPVDVEEKMEEIEKLESDISKISLAPSLIDIE